MAERIDVVDIEFGNSQQEAEKLTKSLDELKQELYALEKGSDAYNKKLQEVAAESKRLTAINEELEKSTQSAGEKFETVLGAAEGFSGAIQIAEGTLQAFGIQSEAAEEAIAKLQGVMAITDGLRAIKENYKALSDLTKMIKSSTTIQRLFTTTKRADAAATTAQTAAMTGYTTATTTATTATKVFRTLLLTSGIGAAIIAITAAVGKLSDMWQEFKDSLNLPNLDAIKDVGDTISSTADKITKSGIYDDIRNMSADTLLKSIKEGTVDIENSLGDLLYASTIFKKEIGSLQERYEKLNFVQRSTFGDDILKSIDEYKTLLGDLDRIFQSTAGDKYSGFLKDSNTALNELYDKTDELFKLIDKTPEELQKMDEPQLTNWKSQYEELLSITKQVTEEHKKIKEGVEKGAKEAEKGIYFDPYYMVQAETAYENLKQLGDTVNKIYDNVTKKQEEANKKQEEATKAAEEYAKKQKELAENIRKVNEELDKAYREIEINQMDEREGERAKLKDEYDADMEQLDEYLDQKLITEEKYQQMSTAYANEYNRKLVELNEKWAKEDLENEKTKYEEKLQAQRDYIAEYINNTENNMIEGLRSLNEQVEKSVDDPIQNVLDRQELNDKEKQYLESAISSYKNLMAQVSKQFPELSKEMNSYLVQLEERLSTNTTEAINLIGEKIKAYASTISEAFANTSSAMSDITSFGDGLSSEWANVADKVSSATTKMGDSISELKKKMEDNSASWKDYGNVVASSLTSAFTIGSSAMSALAAEQQQIIDDIDGTDEASMKRKAEAFEKQKQYEVAGATMSMLGGITSAIATAFQLGPIMGPIIGGINAALVATTGGMQIAQIKKQKNPYSGATSGSDTATPSTTALQMLGSGVNATTNIEGASVESEVKDQKVYVLESDVRSTMNRVKVAETESTF